MKKIFIAFLIVWGSRGGILTKLHKLVYSTLLLTTLFCVLSECSKHPGHLSTTNYVSAVTPSSGSLGDTIIISGTNFNSEPNLDTVSLNGVLAQVVSATSSSITAIVPPGAMTGYLTVNAKNSVATNKTMFTVINIYVCGTVYNTYGDPGQSIVWENGVPAILSSNSASANAISVSGSDVYVAGIEDSGVLVNFYMNGVGHNLFTGNGNTVGAANSIEVVGSDVYVAGSINSVPFVPTACYWKNGNQVTLSGLAPSSAHSMAVVGSDIFVSGQTGPSMSSFNLFALTPTYWKNGVAVPLSFVTPNSSSNPGTADGIAVSGNDIYVVGRVAISQAIPDTILPVIWKNGIPSVVSPDIIWANSPLSIFISGTDIYVLVVGSPQSSGTLSNQVELWKNGQLIQTLGSNSGSASSLFVLGTDVYMSGTDSLDKPCFWKNKRAIELPDVQQNPVVCNSIYVTR